MISPQDVADVLNAAGIDTSQKFAGFIGAAGPLIRRNELLSQIEGLRRGRQQSAAATEAQIQDLQRQVAEIDSALAGQ